MSKKGKVAGTEPRKDQLKSAAEKIPGLIDEVLERYRDENTETAPRQKRREAELATQQGEINKYDRIGGWMNEMGFGGSRRTGPNGVVFMAHVTNSIGSYNTHFSQYVENATLPPNGLNSTVYEAVDALFKSQTNTKCPHITVEIGKRGSDENAHYDKSGIFNAGAIPEAEQDKFRADMSLEFDRVMAIFRSRLVKILA